MPLFLVPLLAGGLGFGAGVLTSDGIAKLTRLGLLVGVGYIAFTQINK